MIFIIKRSGAGFVIYYSNNEIGIVDSRYGAFGWEPKTSFDNLIKLMVDSDIKELKTCNEFVIRIWEGEYGFLVR